MTELKSPKSKPPSGGKAITDRLFVLDLTAAACTGEPDGSDRRSW
jgi:hypothetical protein